MIKIIEQKQLYHVNFLLTEFEKIFRTYFPKSNFSANFSDNIVPVVHITFTLASDKSEVSYGIWQNDPMFHTFSIYFKKFMIDKDGYVLVDILPLEIGQSRLYVPAPKGTNRVYNSIKIPYRKTTGSKERILKAFATYISKLQKAVIENIDRIEVSYDLATKLPPGKAGRRRGNISRL